MVSTIRAGDMTYDRLDIGCLDEGGLDDQGLDDRGLDDRGLGIAKFEDENNAPDKALSRKAAL
jgi:hypothetical protein